MPFTPTQAANLNWRDFVVDGVQSSGKHKVIKSDLRTWGGELETYLNARETSVDASITGINAAIDVIDDKLDGTSPVTGIDINSGSVDGASIGAATPDTGAFTTLSVTTDPPLKLLTAAYAGDLDTLSASGRYILGAASNGWLTDVSGAYLDHTEGTSGNALQKGYDPTYNVTFIRYKVSSSWTPWKLQDTILYSESVSGVSEHIKAIPPFCKGIEIDWYNFTPDTTNQSINLRVGTGTVGSPTWIVAGYDSMQISVSGNTTPTGNFARYLGTNAWLVTFGARHTTGGYYGSTGKLKISGFNDAALPLSYEGQSFYYDPLPDNADMLTFGGSLQYNAAAHTLIRFHTNLGNFTSFNYVMRALF